MSGPHGSRSVAAQPKQISSRLLNMKFMQRATAADKTQPASSPRTPVSQSPFKRRRTDEFYSGNESPSTPGTPQGSYNNAFANPTPTSASASKARNNFEGNTIETQWVLNVKPQSLQGRPNQYSQSLDEEEEEEEDDDDDDIWNTSRPSGRQTYGSFKKKRPTTGASTTTDSQADDKATPASSKSAKRNAKRKDRGSQGAMDLLIDDTPFSNPQSNSDMDSSDDDDNNNDDTNSDSGSSRMSTSQEPTNTHGDRAGSRSKSKIAPIDFLSDEYNRKLDQMDFRKSGFGKQRPGLSGGGGGGGGGGAAGGRRSQGNTPKNRGKLGGQALFDQNKKKQRKSM